MSGKKKVDVGGGESLRQNPFDALSGTGLGEGPSSSLTGPIRATDEKQQPKPKARKSRGRIEIRREKSGRGGKTVTTATAFQGACPEEQQEWSRELRKRCGVGGTWRPGAIEIQGDRREEMVRFFEEKGFRPVLAGG